MLKLEARNVEFEMLNSDVGSFFASEPGGGA